MRRLALIFGVLSVVSMPAVQAQKMKEPVAPVSVDKAGLALGGYDPVAYFSMSKAVPGKPEFNTDWNGAKWRFASAENRDLFIASPEKYAPQFGGYCAWAVSEGYTAPADPKAWKIVEGKLYVNYNTDVQKKWQMDEAERVRKGEVNWPKLHN